MLKLQIEVERLTRGPIDIDATVPPVELGVENDQEYILRRPVTIHLRARTAGHDSVIVDGKLDFIAETECVRCLEPLVFPVSKKFTLAYMRRPDGERGDPADEDNDNLFFEGDIIHPAEQIREEMLLALPYLPKCETQANRVCEPMPTTFGGETPAAEKPAPVVAPLEKKSKKNRDNWKEQLDQVRNKIDRKN